MLNNLQMIDVEDAISYPAVVCRNLGIDIEDEIRSIEKKVHNK